MANVDKNEKYAYESEDAKPVDEKTIVRTFDAPQEEKFTIKELEEKIARIEEQKTALDADIAVIQEKIDEATATLTVK
jgi:uncharacterized protein YegJ (DUF2314 family)